MNSMNFSDNAIDVAIQALEELKAERTLRISAETQLEEQKQKVRFADAVSASEDSILVSDMAIILKQSGVDIGETRFYAWLRGNGYVYRQPCGQNLPSQHSLELGIMELKHVVTTNAYGRKYVRRTPMITSKGRDYFFDKVTAQRDVFDAIAAEKKEQKRLRKNERARKNYAKNKQKAS